MSDAHRAERSPRQGRRFPPSVLVSALLTVSVIMAALFAAYVSPHDPLKQSLARRLAPPSLTRAAHWLGTDQLGRDILSRIIYGSRASLAVGFAAVIVGGLVGSVLGLVSGYFGGKLDSAVMMVVDAQLAFPVILLAIAIIAVLGPSFTNLVIVVGLSGWVTYARIIRGQVLTLKSREFVDAIRGLGGGAWRIIFRHILPNSLSPLIVLATLDLARTIILESTLSFLGLGVQPPTPSWGLMISDGREYLDTAWWVATFPGLTLMATALAVSRLGDWLRDVMDPTLRGFA